MVTPSIPEVSLADITQQVKQRRPMSPSANREAPRIHHSQEEDRVELIVESKDAEKQLTQSDNANDDEDDDDVPMPEMPMSQIQEPQTDSDDSECEQDKSIMVEQLSDDDFSEADLLETKSMRQKYRILHKLPLPTHMKHIFNLFCQLDTYLNLLKRRRQTTWQVTHSELQKMIEHSMLRNFKIPHF